MFEGNHFYLHNARQALADSIRGELLTADRPRAMAETFKESVIMEQRK
jgi:surfactin synthase thioesterase subunit